MKIESAAKGLDSICSPKEQNANGAYQLLCFHQLTLAYLPRISIVLFAPTPTYLQQKKIEVLNLSKVEL